MTGRGIALALLAWPAAALAEVQFFCSFEDSPTECGFFEQAKIKGRAVLVERARHGVRSVMLRTEPGDSHVHGSGALERNDLALSQAATDCYEGRVHWWAHSLLFPDGFEVPESGLVFDFHHTGATGQANFQLRVSPKGLRFEGAGGPVVATRSSSPGRYFAGVGALVRNRWYDFVYHVKWSSQEDGFMYAWVNGALKLAHRGPTLYAGQGCYLKLANYHTPTGPSAVLHDRIVRGASAEAVALAPLERLAATRAHD